VYSERVICHFPNFFEKDISVKIISSQGMKFVIQQLRMTLCKIAKRIVLMDYLSVHTRLFFGYFQICLNIT